MTGVASTAICRVLRSGTPWRDPAEAGCVEPGFGTPKRELLC